MEKKILLYSDILQKLVNYCVYQDRCHQEVEEKMKGFVLIPEAKEEILLYLIKENYLNEERFARSYARGKFYQKKWGKLKIRQHLRQKSISERLIKDSFTEIDPEDYAETLAKVAQSYYDKQTGQEWKKRQKTWKYLVSRGYEVADIEVAMARLDYSE